MAGVSKGDLEHIGRNVLVVDDEPLIRMSLGAFFEDEGYTVIEADSADTAIATLECHAAIHIVITDVQMPGSMDGLKLAHFVRDRWPPTILIVSSGVARLTGADLPSRSAFVAKPVDLQHIVQAIEQLSMA